jgi:alkylated DNA repair protein (DNA oxidative demethylase)
MARSPTVEEEPEGLVYAPGFLAPAEEAALLGALDGMAFDEVRMMGQPAKRTVRHFGYRYDYESWALEPVEPLPEALLWLRDRCGELAGVPGEELAEALVTRYPPGAGIGWHRDAPLFGPKVVGVSLLSSCPMRFQRRAGGTRRVHKLELEPRSAYVLGGQARSAWQHSIPATKGLRYSFTFRTLGAGRRPPPASVTPPGPG